MNRPAYQSANLTHLLKTKQQGFTLIELVIVIVLLGILSVGISGFIKLGSEMFVDVKNRSEIVATARFSMERLNRELRRSLPNSIIVDPANGFSTANIQCIEYTPIITTAHYLDIPTNSANEDETNSISVIDFNVNGLVFDGVNDIQVVVYPTADLSANDIISLNNATLDNVTHVDVDAVPPSNRWDINFSNNVLFATDSPTQRLYFIDEQVTYCVSLASGQLKRFVNAAINDITSSLLFFNANGVLMAQDLLFDNDRGEYPFRVSEPTQSRNSTALIKLIFEKNDEVFTFNNEVHIPNAP